MAATIPSPDTLKAQAKRLRAYLKERGADLSHSHSLEAIATVHGHKDWNTLLAASRSSLRLWVVYCSFSEDGNDDSGWGTFQCYVPASSPEEVEMWCTKELPSLVQKSRGGAFSAGHKVYIDDIVAL